MSLSGVVFDSPYFQTWREHCGLKKPAFLATVKILGSLQEYLIESGFEGSLDFERFTYYLESNDFEPISKEFIDQFVQHFVASNPSLSNKTIYNKISSLKGFFNFLDRVNMISHNPMANYTNKYYERNINLNFESNVV